MWALVWYVLVRDSLRENQVAASLFCGKRTYWKPRNVSRLSIAIARVEISGGGQTAEGLYWSALFHSTCIMATRRRYIDIARSRLESHW